MRRMLGGHPDGKIRLSFFETEATCLLRGLTDWRGRQQIVSRIQSWRSAWLDYETAPTIDCICQINSSWSVHADNGRTSVTGLVYTMSRRLRTRALRFNTMLPTGNAVFPSYSMEYHDARLGEADAIDRHVGVYADTRWKFENSGKPLSFENTDAYFRRSIKERVTHNLLCNYALWFGLCLENENDFPNTFVIQR